MTAVPASATVTGAGASSAGQGSTITADACGRVSAATADIAMVIIGMTTGALRTSPLASMCGRTHLLQLRTADRAFQQLLAPLLVEFMAPQLQRRANEHVLRMLFVYGGLFLDDSEIVAIKRTCCGGWQCCLSAIAAQALEAAAGLRSN